MQATWPQRDMGYYVFSCWVLNKVFSPARFQFILSFLRDIVAYLYLFVDLIFLMNVNASSSRHSWFLNLYSWGVACLFVARVVLWVIIHGVFASFSCLVLFVTSGLCFTTPIIRDAVVRELEAASRRLRLTKEALLPVALLPDSDMLYDSEAGGPT